jgi:hypothetical protein
MKSADLPQPVTWGQVSALLGVVVGLAAAWWAALLGGAWVGAALLPVPLAAAVILVRSEVRAQRWHAFELSLVGVEGRAQTRRHLRT